MHDLRINQVPACRWQTAPAYAIIFFLCSMGLASSFVYLGSIGWPGLHWDASLYGTPVINVANGNGWNFGSLTMQILQRKNLLYNYHGFLHVFVYGSLLKASTWSLYILYQSIVNAITFFAYSLVYFALLTRRTGVSIGSLLSGLLLGVIPGVVCIGLQGRPEQLAPLVLLIPFLSILFLNNYLHLLIALGFSLGLLIVLSPLLGIFFAVFICFYLYIRNNIKTKLFLLYSAACISWGVLVSFILVAVLTPFTPLDWYLNVISVSKVALNFEGSLLALKRARYGVSIIAPFWNILSLLFLAIGAAALWVAKRNVLSILLAGLAFAYFNEKMIDYGYAPLIPFALAICLLVPDRAYAITRSHPSLKLINAFVLFAASTYLYILVSFIVIVLTAPTTETHLSKAKQLFEGSAAGQELANRSSAVGFEGVRNPSLVVFGDASNRYVNFSSGLAPSLDESLTSYEEKTGLRMNYFVYPQNSIGMNGALSNPPSKIFIGQFQFDLQDNYWAKGNVLDRKIRPLNLGNRYSFALYKRSS